MITVNDIREKEFSKQKHGYHEDEVDDFLDEIADQMESLIRENRTLLDEVEALQSRPAEVVPAEPVAEPAAPAEPVAPPVSFQPPVDEPSYFKNLEATLRETLISAQRIADNTVAEARVKAKDLVTSAEDQARMITAEANVAAQNASSDLDAIKKALTDYKSRFRRMIKEQMAVVDIDDLENEEAKAAE